MWNHTTPLPKDFQRTETDQNLLHFLWELSTSPQTFLWSWCTGFFLVELKEPERPAACASSQAPQSLLIERSFWLQLFFSEMKARRKKKSCGPQLQILQVFWEGWRIRTVTSAILCIINGRISLASLEFSPIQTQSIAEFPWKNNVTSSQHGKNNLELLYVLTAHFQESGWNQAHFRESSAGTHPGKSLYERSPSLSGQQKYKEASSQQKLGWWRSGLCLI